MLEVENLYKYYGSFAALDGLSLSIKKGELFGFVGPNGAGKTTTMRIICGLLKADKGQVHVDGTDALKDYRHLKDKIGYMPDFFGVYDNLKVMEYMEFYASIYGMNGKAARDLCLNLLDMVNLADKTGFYVDDLSRGMKQRLCLARCLIHDPKLLILDEPASGLDPRARFEMKEILKNLADMDKTILISSHILPELAEMCSSIGIIQAGQMVLQGAVDEILMMMASANPLVITMMGQVERAVAFLKGQPLVENLSYKDNVIRVDFQGNSWDEAYLLEELVSRQLPVCAFAREEGSLESLFMQITTHNGGGTFYAN
ncbi:MAG TPA: ABC transporter ATP-binding protein [Candidatus Scybalocola faecigallinarum]|uniref:ABC transporter ATP-binding protein n=1 Tax=Candidatus Scybalocola faecigallinarum TaxID=2840941 RepID=A0A9D1F7K2_9FIRM|nr:ABC transporter ATP-binding protein [Candidatus Scybalocola faecigallinarum]